MARLSSLLTLVGIAAVGGSMALTAPADAGPTKKGAARKAPSPLFQSLARSVTKAGFHLNSKDPDGWYEASICRMHAKVAACTLLSESWASSIVADAKHEGDAVVQELWVFVYASSADAATGLASLQKDFEYGPFAKHPYQLYACGREIFATEGRFRWHTAGKQLNAHVGAFVSKKCANKK